MTLTGESISILGALAGVLIIASLVGLALRFRPGDESWRATVQNLNERIISWWVMVAITGAACVGGRGLLILLFAAISFFALREIVTLLATHQGDRRATLTAFLLVLPFQYWLIWMDWYGLFALLIPVYAFIVLPILAAMSEDTRDFLGRTAGMQWALMVAVYCISYVPALERLNPPGFEKRGVVLVAFLLIVTQSSDVLQYIFGKFLGRHKIAPQLSPSKTVEGTIGGITAATLLGTALWHITPFTRIQAMMMALAISTLGFLGGLVMSAIKRDRGVKDWGVLIGGHGGMLDRLDSVCFSAPIFYHLTRYFYR